jgi:hypothetical protein
MPRSLKSKSLNERQDAARLSLNNLLVLSPSTPLLCSSFMSTVFRYDDLIQVKRARHHVKVGEAMEKVYSKNLDTRAEDLAFHFSEGGDTARGIRYSIMAGDRNKAIHAYEQAISDYKRALDLIDSKEARIMGRR